MRRGPPASTGVVAAVALLSGAAPLCGQRIPADPQISPDGQLVAFIIHELDAVTGEPYSNLALMATSGIGLERITEGPRIDRTPRFSPDGRRLAWVTFVDGFWELRVRNLDTRQTRELAVGSLPHGAIAWSPTGDRIAYTRTVRDPDESEGPVHVFVVPASGGRPLRVSREGFHSGGIELGTPLSWTPDGTAIVLAARAGRDAQIFEIVVANGLERVLAPREGPDRDPAVSPDGRFVAYTGSDGGEGEERVDRLYVAERTRPGFPRVVSRGLDLSVRHPIWTPDGRGIFAIIEYPNVDRLALFALDGTHRIVADSLDRPEERLSTAVLGATRFTASADPANPRYAVTTSHPDRPAEVGVGGTRFGDPVRAVSALNADLADADLPELEEIRLVAGPVVGWALRPVGAGLAGPSLPGAIIDARADGVFSGARFDPTRQALVAAGYVVIVSARDAAGTRDLLETVETVIARAADLGWIDAQRVFLLASLAEDDVRGVIADAEPKEPFLGVLYWTPQRFERTPLQIQATLEWLESFASPAPDGGPP